MNLKKKYFFFRNVIVVYRNEIKGLVRKKKLKIGKKIILVKIDLGISLQLYALWSKFSFR